MIYTNSRSALFTFQSNPPRMCMYLIGHPAHFVHLHLSLDQQLPDRQEAAGEAGEYHI